MLAGIVRTGVLLLVATVVGAGWAGYRGFPWTVDPDAVAERRRIASEAEKVGDETNIDLARLRELIGQQATIIDARAPEQFEAGHLQVFYEPPVLNIPPETFDQNLDRLFALMGTTMVLYCNSETCHLAEELYVRLQEQGFAAEPARIYIYKPGWDGLQQTDLPTTTGPDTWTGYGSVPAGDEHPYGGADDSDVEAEPEFDDEETP